MAKPRSRHEQYQLLIVFIVGVAIVLSIATLLIARDVQNNSDQIARLERQHVIELRSQLQASRGAEYRICLRQMVTRAVLDLDAGHDERHLPLYDCSPNLQGKIASLMSPVEARAFKQQVRSVPIPQLP